MFVMIRADNDFVKFNDVFKILFRVNYDESRKNGKIGGEKIIMNT